MKKQMVVGLSLVVVLLVLTGCSLGTPAPIDKNALKQEIKTELKSEILDELRDEMQTMNMQDAPVVSDDGADENTQEPQQVADSSDTLVQENSVQSTFGYTFNYNDKWSDVSGELNPDAEFEFELGQGSAYAMIISEEIEVGAQLLRDTILENVEAGGGTDIEILNEETIVHDGREVLSLQVRATIQGTVFVYRYYIYTGDEGSLQIITFTGGNLFDKYENDLELFLKGLSF